MYDLGLAYDPALLGRGRHTLVTLPFEDFVGN